MAVMTWAEFQGDPHLSAVDTDSGVNLEGKETHFRVLAKACLPSLLPQLPAGQVDTMHNSFTSLGRMVPMWLTQIGEVVFGVVGSGLYDMLLFVLLAVFISGLMIGRMSEYLGKNRRTEIDRTGDDDGCRVHRNAKS